MVSNSELLVQDISQFSSHCVHTAIEEALTDLRQDMVFSEWCCDVTTSAVKLSAIYCEFTEDILETVLFDAFKDYEQYYDLVHHVIPSADRIAESLIYDAINLHIYCHELTDDIIELVKKDLADVLHQKRLEMWAEQEACKILKCGVSKLSTKKSRKRAKLSGCLSNGSLDSSNHHGAYADTLVCRIFSDCKLQDSSSYASTSSHSEKSRDSQCGSCESMSSGLLSPQSIADSSGLYRFADKLLYSLSALEKGSNESISSADMFDSKFSIVDCYRRSSAPELRVSSRKSSLKTVFEELPVEYPVTSSHSHRKSRLYPSTSLGRRLRSSDERRCTSMENIDDAPVKSSYSETLAKDILFSAYRDVM